MSSSQKNAIKLNITQNSFIFELEPIKEQSIIFKKKLFSKVLNAVKSEPEKLENYRTVIVKCLYPGCR